MSQTEIERLLDERQYYFLPYYDDVVSAHPFGIEAADVKAWVRDEIITRHGFDPFDEAITPINSSTGVSSASQWANNLVSNRVLEQYMVVARGGHRVVLYPLSGDDNSRPVDDGSGAPLPIGDELEEAADDRPPVFEEAESGRYRRSAALAELVRQRAGYQCIVDTEDCVTFLGANGTPYVEVHHVIPMAMQGTTGYNLDRVANMVTVCVACHTKLHKGSWQIAGGVQMRLLERYELLRGSPLTVLLGDCDIPHTIDDLLAYCVRT